MAMNFMGVMRLISCDFLRRAITYNSPSADRIHEVCMLFKDVKMTCDLDGFRTFSHGVVVR